MDIKKEIDGNTTSLKISGRLDTITAPELEKELHSINADKLIIDCAELEYISSAGLRILLSAHKEYSKKGGMEIHHVSSLVMDIFDVTGFKDILNFR